MAIAGITVLFLALVGSIAGLSVAISKPLVSLAGFYDLHLFPENDQFDYRVSEIHRASQSLHIIALVLFVIALISLMSMFVFSAAFSDRANRDCNVLVAAATIAAAATYAAALATLLKMALDYKKLADDLPDLPFVPESKVEIGSIMDIVGFIFAITGAVAVMSGIFRTNSEGHIRL
jgi:hypothetical protein